MTTRQWNAMILYYATNDVHCNTAAYKDLRRDRISSAQMTFRPTVHQRTDVARGDFLRSPRGENNTVPLIRLCRDICSTKCMHALFERRNYRVCSRTDEFH